jgi:hypothetical protein
MIPYADFELGLARWKARKEGTPMASQEFPSGAVAAEVPNPNAEPPERAVAQSSGLIVISEYDAPTPGPE